MPGLGQVSSVAPLQHPTVTTTPAFALKASQGHGVWSGDTVRHPPAMSYLGILDNHHPRYHTLSPVREFWSQPERVDKMASCPRNPEILADKDDDDGICVIRFRFLPARTRNRDHEDFIAQK